MTAPAATAAPDEDPDLAADRRRLGQLLLPLGDDIHLIDLPAALTTIRQRRLDRLINLRRRPTMTLAAIPLPRTPSRPPWLLRRLATRERRRLALGLPAQLLDLRLQLRHTRVQPPATTPQPLVLPHQPLVLGQQPRRELQQAVATITGSDRQLHHSDVGGGRPDHRPANSSSAT